MIVAALIIGWLLVILLAVSLARAAGKPTPPVEGPGVVERERY